MGKKFFLLSTFLTTTFLMGICPKSLCQSLKAAYNIYPIPQKMFVTQSETSFSKTITIVSEDGIDDVTNNRAKQILSEKGFNVIIATKPSNASNLFLGINGSKAIADKKASSLKLNRNIFSLDKYDKHILSLFAKGSSAQVLIIGENTDAVFCGLASLEQMLDWNKAEFPCVNIYDWADIKNRGVIEGYYGVPYSAAVTKDLFRFMARYKLNTYMYGAKSDPYHSKYWSEPYPTSITPEQEHIGYLTQEMMKDITDVAKACKVNFIWAIHPGNAFADPNNKEIIAKIMKKFESMYALGVRQFGVFVDDVGVPSDTTILKLCADNLANLQTAIDARWNKQGTPAADTVKALNYVPQLYAYSWVAENKAKEFYESLRNVPDKINIYITGANVWSVPNNRDLKKVEGWLGKKTSWWWNYLCNDPEMSKIFLTDMSTNFRDEKHILGTIRIENNIDLKTLIVNPMQQGTLSKIGLFSVGDFAWNSNAFNNNRSWEAAIPAVVGKDRAKDLMNIIPALRYYDNDEFEYWIPRYKASVEKGKPAPNSLIIILKRLYASCLVIEKMKDSPNESDRLFYNDLRPWLKKLEAMTTEATLLLENKPAEAIDYENNLDFRFDILTGMGDEITTKKCTAELSAKCLLPFIYWLREQNNKQ